MGDHKNSKSRTIRLPIDLMQRIEREADDLELTPNAVILRRLTKSYSRDSEQRKPLEKEQEVAFGWLK